MLGRKRTYDPQDLLAENSILALKKIRYGVLRDTDPEFHSHQEDSSYLGSIKDENTRRYSRETLLSLRFASPPSSEIKRATQAIHDSLVLNQDAVPSKVLCFVNRSTNRVIQIDSLWYGKLSRRSENSTDSVKLKFSVFRKLCLGQSINRKNNTNEVPHQNTRSPTVLSPSSPNTHLHPTRLPTPSHNCTHNPGPISTSIPTRHDPSHLPPPPASPFPTQMYSSSPNPQLGSSHGTNPGYVLSSDLSGKFQSRQGSKRRIHDHEEIQMGDWRIAKKRRIGFKSCYHFGPDIFWSSWSAD